MIFASGLKYVGIPVTVLGWILALILLAAVVWLAWVRPWRYRDREASPQPADAEQQSLADQAARGTRPG